MKLKAAQVVMVAVALAAAPSMVSATVVDFEGFADFADIEGVNLGGVTITNPGGNVEIYASNRFGVAFHSATKAIGSFDGGAEQQPHGLHVRLRADPGEPLGG